MEKAYWLDRWERADIGFNQPQGNELLKRYFPELAVPLGARVLVPLCGKTVDMLWLSQQGCFVIGIELSERACRDFFLEQAMAMTELKQGAFTVFKGERITLFSGDFFSMTPGELGPIDAVYDRAALIALPQNLRKRYAAHIEQHMPVGCQSLLITSCYDESQMEGPPFSVGETTVRTLFSREILITQLYKKRIREIPTHLQDAGLREAEEEVYLLKKIKPA